MFTRDLSSLQMGQKVAVVGRHSTNTDYMVKRITPTGFVTVSRQRVSKWEGDKPVAHEEHCLKFNKDNHCLTEFYKDVWIRTDLDAIAEEARVKKVRGQIASYILQAADAGWGTRSTYGKDSMERIIAHMEAKLAEAKALLPTI